MRGSGWPPHWAQLREAPAFGPATLRDSPALCLAASRALGLVVLVRSPGASLLTVQNVLRYRLSCGIPLALGAESGGANSGGCIQQAQWLELHELQQELRSAFAAAEPVVLRGALRKELPRPLLHEEQQVLRSGEFAAGAYHCAWSVILPGSTAAGAYLPAWCFALQELRWLVLHEAQQVLRSGVLCRWGLSLRVVHFASRSRC